MTMSTIIDIPSNFRTDALTKAAVAVLVVDDNPTNRVLCRHALTKKGFEVREAVDGCEALSQVEQQPPDVVLMDVKMPNMDGLECTRRLKACPKTCDIPVIILSACTDASDIMAGLEAGADEYLSKPLRLLELEVRLRSMVRAYRDRKEIAHAREAQAATKALEAELVERRRMEEALRQAKDAAEAANQAKSEFLATMSHELRTPLNGVIGMTELLLRTCLDDRQRHYASVAKHSGDALLCLIKDILDFSKIEAGKVELESVEFDVQDIITSIVATFEEAAKAKGLTLVGTIHSLAPSRVRGDAGRLQQVLMNLTSNALKFTEQGQITIRAVVEDESCTHQTMRFTVDDTGIGIPSQRLDRLFRSFSQVDASTTRKYGGTGLGLAIGKRLVEMMGGTIGVSTESGRGSTFWFTVRFVRACAPGEGTKTFCDDLRAIRVLVVDDNKVNRDILIEQLDGCGIRTQAACDGSSAIDALVEAANRGAPMNIAILDMNMPGLDGESLARVIKSNPELSDTVLIMLASSDPSRDEEQLRASGFAAWLAKPVGTPRLLEVIASAMACATRTQAQLKLQEGSRSDLAAAARDAQTLRILLVDDNEIGREVGFATLTQAGYCCDIANDGRQAVDAAERCNYDIILMDCQMPTMDGFEATSAIRQSELTAVHAGQPARHVPIVALTANAMTGDRKRCAAAGMDEFLTKPFAAEDLIKVIQRLTKSNISATTDSDSAATPTPPCHIKPANETARLDINSVPEPFVVDAILKRWGGDRQFAGKLIKMFQGQVSDFIAALRRSIDAGDHQETANVAHGLKGAAAYVSAEAVRALAEQLEKLGRAADLSGAQSYFTQIDEELRRCIAFRNVILESDQCAYSVETGQH